MFHTPAQDANAASRADVVCRHTCAACGATVHFLIPSIQPLIENRAFTCPGCNSDEHVPLTTVQIDALRARAVIIYRSMQALRRLNQLKAISAAVAMAEAAKKFPDAASASQTPASLQPAERASEPSASDAKLAGDAHDAPVQGTSEPLEETKWGAPSRKACTTARLEPADEDSSRLEEAAAQAHVSRASEDGAGRSQRSACASRARETETPALVENPRAGRFEVQIAAMQATPLDDAASTKGLRISAKAQSLRVTAASHAGARDIEAPTAGAPPSACPLPERPAAPSCHGEGAPSRGALVAGAAAYSGVDAAPLSLGEKLQRAWANRGAKLPAPAGGRASAAVPPPSAEAVAGSHQHDQPPTSAAAPPLPVELNKSLMTSRGDQPGLALPARRPQPPAIAPHAQRLPHFAPIVPAPVTTRPPEAMPAPVVVRAVGVMPELVVAHASGPMRVRGGASAPLHTYAPAPEAARAPAPAPTAARVPASMAALAFEREYTSSLRRGIMAQVDAYIRGDATLRDAEAWDPTLRERLHKQFYAACYSRHQQVLLAARAGALTEAGAAPYFVPHSSPARPPGASVVVSGVPGAESAAAPRAVFQPRVPPGPPSQTLLAAQRLLSRPPSAQAPYISSLAGPPPAREEDEGSDGEQPDSPLSESDGEANAFTTYVPQWTSAGLSEDARGREEALQSPPHKKNKETIAGSFGEDFKIKSPSPPPSIDFSPQNSPPTSRPIPPPLLRAPPPHPVPVVEAQSLAAVPLPPPLVRAPAAERAALHGRLSAVQFEAVALATQRHATALSDGRRAAFFLGDGAGVGKGRTLAALVLDAWAAGRRRHVWVSVGPDLAVDARRDLDDVGAGHVPLHALAKLPYGALASKRLGVTQGVLFLSYATLTSVAERGASRYRQILAWCGGAEFEGLVMFDESHRAKNLTSDRGRSSQIGLRVGDLQAALPAARVVYCSATGASEPRNMAYMTRLGLWAERNKANAPAAPSSLPWRPLAVAPPPPFGSFADFLEALSSSRGAAGALALQELVAVDLKAAGAYVCRTLSFAGTEFVLAEAPLEPEAEASYAASARFWIKLRLAFADAEAALERAEGGKGDDEAHSRPRPESDQLADAGTTKRPASRGGGRSAPQSSPLWRAFWAAHQRFFRALCLSAKVSEAARLARTALAEGKCVVVGLQTTGEASTAETHARAGGQPLDDFASGPREMLLRLLRDAYPMPPDPRARSSTEGSSQFVAPRNAAQEGRREGAARRAAAGQVCYREKNESEHSFLFTSSSEGGKERKKRRRLEGREKALEKVPTSAPPIVESDTTETCASSDNSSSSFESSSDSLPTSTSTPDKLKRRRPASDSAQARAASDDEPKAPLLQTQSLRPASRSPLPQGQAGIGQPKRSKTIVDSSTSQSGSESSSSSVSSAPCSETSTSCQGCKGSDEGDSGGSSQRASSAAAPSLPSGSEYSGAEPSTSPAAVAAYEAARARRDALAAEAGALPLPPNPLDDLIERLGGSDEVAEMTGRRSRLVRDPKTGLVVLESRGARLGEQERAGEEGEEGEEGEGSEARPVEAVNVRERALFQSGRKLVAVISEAASAGISLHADARAGNQRRRVHLTMELPWAADRAIQQFGRTHRAGQVCGPQVKLLFTPLGGERRFAAAVARRLQSLGALTMGDRRAGGAARALAALDLDCPMGRAALREVYAAALVRGLPGCEGLEPLLAASGDLSESEAHLRHASNSAQPVSSAAKARAALLGMGLARVNAVKFPELSLEKALALATGPPEDSAAVPERHRADVPRFLNRLMGLPPDYQAALFGAFEAALAALRQQARAAGAMDHGVTTCRDFCVRLAAEPAVVLRGTPMDPRQPGGARGAGEGQGTGPGSAKGSGADRSPANSPSPSAAAGGAVQLASGTALSLVHLECDRGVPWEAAEQVLAAWQAHHVEPREPSRPPAVETAQKTSLSRLLELLGLPSRCAHAEGVEPLSMPPAKFEDSNVSGFYASDFGRGNQVKVLLALHSSRSPGTVTVLRPSSGLAAGGMRLERLQEHWTHIALSAKAAALWRERHAAALQPRERQPALRPRRLLLLVGAVLRGWGVVSREIAALPNKKDRRLSIVRVETTEGEPRRFIGILVPQGACKCIAEKLLELDEAVGG